MTTNAAIHLTANEGAALQVAQLLVGAGKGALPPMIDLTSPSPPLLEAVARTLAVGALQFLLKSGGAKERVVVRNGKRASGRLWDRELNELFDVRFTRVTRNFWMNVGTKLPPLANRRRQQAEHTRADRQTIATLAPDGFDGVGDLLFIGLAHENAGALQLPFPVEELFRHELRKTGPLALLLGADDPDIDDRAARGLLHTLTAPGPMRAIECLDNALVEAWLVRFRVVLVHSEDRVRFIAHMNAMARTLTTWVKLLDGAGRLDLARAVARFLVALPLRAMPVGLDIRNHCLKLHGTTSIGQRDEALASIQRVLDVRILLDEARQRLGNERFGDERYMEAQVFIRMLEEELVPQRGPIEALARAVSGAVG